MSMSRMYLVGPIVGLLMGVAVSPSLAQPSEEVCVEYPSGNCVEILAQTFGPDCEDEVPSLGYRVRFGAGLGDTVDITFMDPDGADVRFDGQPLTGELLWPGASENGDGEIRWPGWSFTDAGWVLQDLEDLTFPVSGVDVLFEVASGASVVTEGLDLTAEPCGEGSEVLDVELARDGQDGASPSGEGVQVLGVQLALTGGSVAVLAGLAGLLGGLGFVLVRFRRSTETG